MAVLLCKLTAFEMGYPALAEAGFPAQQKRPLSRFLVVKEALKGLAHITEETKRERRTGWRHVGGGRQSKVVRLPCRRLGRHGVSVGAKFGRPQIISSSLATAATAAAAVASPPLAACERVKKGEGEGATLTAPEGAFLSQREKLPLAKQASRENIVALVAVKAAKCDA